MLWILESSVPLPTAAILLCAGYFTLALFASLLIHGLATVSTAINIIILTKFIHLLNVHFDVEVKFVNNNKEIIIIFFLFKIGQLKIMID